MKHINIKIIGKVQDVNFRFDTREKAAGLGLKGFIRNEQDGSVYIEAEGEEDILSELVEWCKTGPKYAIVKSTEVEDGRFMSFKEFEIVP